MNAWTVAEQRKCVEKIEEQDLSSIGCSFEFFRPSDGGEELFRTIAMLGSVKLPLWVDITSGPSLGRDSWLKTLEIAKGVIRQGFTVMVHVTGWNRSRDEVREMLSDCRNIGVRNILALRGDKGAGYKAPTKDILKEGQTKSDFPHAIDVVKLIKEEHGNFFCIAVAAYPEGHPEALSLEQDVCFLSEKVKAGADLIVTQFCYDSDAFFKWEELVVMNGINVPVSVGVLGNGKLLKSMAHLCGVKVCKSIPNDIRVLESEQVRKLALDKAIKFCETIIEQNEKRPILFHFYTINQLEDTITIIQSINTHARSRGS